MAETKWKVVPCEATEEMIDAFGVVKPSDNIQDAGRVWGAMLSAAPKPPAGTLLLVSEDGRAEVVDADVVGLLRGAQDAVNAAYAESHAEWQGNDSRMAKHSARVDAWREKARAALSALTGSKP